MASLAASAGEAIALRLNDEQLNWRELCARVDELASGFAVQGVVEDSGVMLRAWNTPQTLLAWLALLQCGARVLPVNPQLPQPLLEELLPNLTLQFALVPDGENTFPALTSLHIQRVEGAHVATWQPTRLCSMTLTSGFYRVAESRCPYLSGPSCQCRRGVIADSVWRSR